MTSRAANLRISVIIDSFNTSAFVGEAIESVLRQTRPADQIIVSDTSTDSSPDIIRALAARSPLVKPVFSRNRGSLATILAGLAAADGDIVLLLDGDDRFQPGHLEAMERRWQEFPDADLIYCRHKIVGDPDLARVFKLRHLHESPPWHGVIDLGQPYDWGRSTALAWCLPDYHIGGITSCLSVRRSHFQDLPLPRMLEESGSLLAQNADFIILLASALFGGRKIYVPEQTVDWRLHTASATGVTEHGNKDSLYRQSISCAAARAWLTSQPFLGPHLQRALDREMQAVPRLAPGHRDLYLRARQEERDVGAELRPQLAAAVRRVAAIEASTSWRLTAPLRWAVNLVRSAGLHPALRFWKPLHHEPGTVVVDVTNIWHADTGTGIQRVVREVASVLPRLGEPGQIVLAEWSSGIPLDVTDAILSGNITAPPGRPVTGVEMLIMLDSSYALTLRLRHQLHDARSKGVKIVSVCHDVFPVTHPELFERATAETFRLWLAEASAFSDAFLCNSRHTASELGKYLASHRTSAHTPLVTSWPLGSNFAAPGPSAHVDETGTSVPEDFLLMVGTVEPRKNHAFVLDALSTLWDSGRLEMPLVIVGRPGWKCRDVVAKIHKLEAKGRVFWHGGGLPDWQLRQLYRSATAFIQASLDEGFGLPVGEAALFARPVVLSDIPVFREIVEADGYFFTQGDRASFESALLRALQPDAPPTKTIAVSWEESAAAFWRECGRLLRKQT